MEVKYCLAIGISSCWRVFSSCLLPRVPKFSAKAYREKMSLENSNIALALVIGHCGVQMISGTDRCLVRL